MQIIGRYVTARHGLTSADVDAWQSDLRALGEQDDYLFSINRYCFLAVAE
jgi:hypothetical protein